MIDELTAAIHRAGAMAQERKQAVQAYTSNAGRTGPLAYNIFPWFRENCCHLQSERRNRLYNHRHQSGRRSTTENSTSLWWMAACSMERPGFLNETKELHY